MKTSSAESVARYFKFFFPIRTRQLLRAYHQKFVFDRAMSAFLVNPEGAIEGENEVMSGPIFGWGNPSWGAGSEYLRCSVRHALASSGPIFECGSGLSTILIEAIAERRRVSHWALEHIPEWGQ
jgi:hypothetical protein